MSILVRACLIAGIPALSTAWASRMPAADDGAPVAAISVTVPAGASSSSSIGGADIRAEAVAIRQARLAGTVSRLERELGSFPDDPDGIDAARRGSDVVAGLEVWDLNAERTLLRRRIDALRERITLFEQIDQRQDKLDRARLVEHQETMVSLATDRAYAGKRKAETEIRLTSSEWTAARRQAKLEMLADVRRELDALAPLPAATPPSDAHVEIRVPIRIEPTRTDPPKPDEVKAEAVPVPVPQISETPSAPAPAPEPVPAPQP